ncbi:DUF4367 domain-containing protein [Haloarcula sediminis]|uniref:DUF4367 domain-containing protein n=1 Tax=Haloarcula sediminis TaxID=3111777 RepID=UPI002D778FF3|nr:DUF4367 domain-containing protein [Haloarcula sp. CK38]
MKVYTAVMRIAGYVSTAMLKLMPSKRILTVALSVLLIASTGAISPAAAAPTQGDTLGQTDVQNPTDSEANLTAEQILETHEEQLDSIETLSFTVHNNYSSESYSSSSTSSMWIDFADEQMRTESESADTISVRNETASVRYDVEEKTVRTTNITFSGADPRDNGFFPFVLNNQSEVTYEETDLLNGTETYRLDINPQYDYSDAEHDVTLWINAETYMPVQYEMSEDSDRYNSETSVQFTNVSINETISDERFSIDIPEDAERPDYSTPDIESYESESELRQNTSQSVPEPELPTNYTFESGYVSDGEDNSSVSLSYTDGDDGSITLSQSTTSEGVSSYYSESDEFENVTVGDHTGYYNEFNAGNSNMSILVWNTGDHQYTIYGSVSQSTVIDIAESMV